MIASARLNNLLIRIRCSLIQYAGESWPWSADPAAQTVVLQVVEEQKTLVARLAALLEKRGHWIEWGVYATEFTSLHYVSLKYLLGRLTVSQRELVVAGRAILKESVGDQEASSLAGEILATLEREQLALDRLNTPAKAA